MSEEIVAEEELPKSDKEMTDKIPPESANEKEIIDAEVSETDLKIKGLSKELGEAKDQYLRTAAEYDNFRKRTAKEKIEVYGDATANAVTEFLGVIDNFERALAAPTSDDAYKSGMQMIFNQYSEILKKLGVAEIECVGKPFDPSVHHAVSQVEDENLGENTVSAVFQKGYTLNGKVVRPAMVVVANP